MCGSQGVEGGNAPFHANECIDYLLSRRKLGRVTAEQHSVLHVISYQRRLSFVKNDFFTRGCTTPLGVVADWWVGPSAARPCKGSKLL